jgi:hypothetical protein
MVDIEKIFINKLPFDIIEHISIFMNPKELYLCLEKDSEIKKGLEKKYKQEVYTEAGKDTFLFGEYHSFNDEPSRIKDNRGVKSFFWHSLGKLHREGDKPAYIRGELKMWFIQGELERGDLPCIEKGKLKQWAINGKRGRKNDLPAIECEQGYQWFVDGKRHREGGLPTIVFPGKYIAYHVHGKKIKDELIDKNFRFQTTVVLII